MEPEIDRNSVCVLSKNCLARNIDDDVIILNATDGIYYGLQNAGARIWSLINGARTVGEILDQIIAEYDVPKPRAAADLKEVLQRLKAKGFIQFIAEEDAG